MTSRAVVHEVVRRARLRRWLSTAGALLLVAACSQSTPAPTAARAAASWSGQTDVETDRSPLAGDYVATWSITVPAGTPVCLFNAYLWGAGSNVVPVTALASESGGTRLHGLRPDRYYLKVGTNCPWTVTLTPE